MKLHGREGLAKFETVCVGGGGGLEKCEITQ